MGGTLGIFSRTCPTLALALRISSDAVCMFDGPQYDFIHLELVCEDESKSCKKWSEGKKLCDETRKYKTERYFVSMSRLCKKSCLMCGDDGMYQCLLF